MYKAQVLDLLRRFSVKKAEPGQEFSLASGEKSPIYIDVKPTALHHAATLPLAWMLYEELASGEFGAVHAVAGVALGGCHLASIVASYAMMRASTRLDTVYVRKEAKPHGTQKMVEGPERNPGDAIVLLEDVVTTGGSSVEAAMHLRYAGYDVRGVLAVVDRRANPRRKLPQGLKVRSLFTLADLA